jgi:DNA-binding protein HU-beta
MNVNKSELVDQLASRSDLKRAEAERALNALTDIVKETLQRGGDVSITGFGKFSVAERGARQGVNPQTGERIQIAASKAPKFSAGADFKKALKSQAF